MLFDQNVRWPATLRLLSGFDSARCLATAADQGDTSPLEGYCAGTLSDDTFCKGLSR